VKGRVAGKMGLQTKKGEITPVDRVGNKDGEEGSPW